MENVSKPLQGHYNHTLLAQETRLLLEGTTSIVKLYKYCKNHHSHDLSKITCNHLDMHEFFSNQDPNCNALFNYLIIFG